MTDKSRIETAGELIVAIGIAFMMVAIGVAVLVWAL